MPDKARVDRVELTQRELLTLRFIQKFTEDHSNVLHRPPTHRQLVDYLNSKLPAQKNGKPAIVSSQQTYRIVVSLRAKGMLHEVQPNERIPNMVLTSSGKRELSRAKI
jgi:hypothetical protein